MVEERLAEAQATNGEKITIEWRGQQRHLYVISMPTDLLYYNPDTHRIRAQRTLNPALDRALESSPFERAAQDYLDTLLKCQPSNPDKTDPDFEALRDDLEQSGQKDPGVITTHGILVNGNTRCAALRELGEHHIRVGVLPESSTWDDINSVELSLQLRKEHKRDYSYINRLIAIDELIKANRRPEDIARAFRIKLATLEQDRWVYSVILDAIERSDTGSGDSLRLVDFEDHQEKLRELHRAYAKVAATDCDAADVLKETRLSMIILGYAKTDVRLAQADFHEKYLDPKLPEAIRPPAQVNSSVVVPGLPGVALPGAAPLAKTARLLTDSLLRAKATAQANGGNATPEEIAKASGTIGAAKVAFSKALEPAGKDIRLQQRKLAAPERLTDACDDIDLCTGELAHAVASRALDEAAFDDAVLKLRNTLERLARQASRSVSEPGEGITWLLDVAKGAS
ncbi:transcriptional regulator [Arthrobacter sp. 135MFCol5.1]|uniref:transcriptional regulator n=1 Tax=Arthrobacter sp. 135MFCol5.1 TaxID=1158050 RepID=UPI001E3BC9E4|nr:transcriptional regulator [Arthrobacter sp. 135MFCol5.1]